MYSRIKIEVRNLNKTFGSNHVLKSVNLDIRSNESLVILGGSGSGKSVLIRCIAGLLIPDPGSTVLIDHDDVTYAHISKRSFFTEKFGMLFQGCALFDSLLVWQNISFALMQAGNINKSDAKKLAIEKLSMVGLKESVADLYPSEISGGMQKRVAIARAIATDPEVLFFDEPTSGLDPLTARSIIQLIKSISKKLNATKVTITHDLVCMANLADKIAMLKDGEILWHGDAKDIYHVDNQYIKDFITI